MKIAILQSNYIPWKGYFDMINMVDEFILYDDVQFTRRDWRNRNLIKTKDGLKWLTIPVHVKGNYFTKINEIVVSDPNWPRNHWNIISQNYIKAPFFKDYREIFENFYLNNKEIYLSKINYNLIVLICEILNIRTSISYSTDYPQAEGKNERLIAICKSCGANYYLSGPAAKNYIDESAFLKEKIAVDWMDYSGYKQYNQLFGDFEHGVSILDLIFNAGPDTNRFMKSFAIK